MTQFVALLRGVNVGGITIKSAELRALFDELGFAEVRTVLASGNVIFASAKRESQASLKRHIEHALRDRFGYDAWIVLVTREELERAADGFPFDADDESRQPWVIFASEAGIVDELTRFADEADPDVDPLAAGDGVVYWHCRRQAGVDSAFSKLTAKARFKPTTTNRNLRTLRKLLA